MYATYSTHITITNTTIHYEVVIFQSHMW